MSDHPYRPLTAEVPTFLQQLKEATRIGELGLNSRQARALEACIVGVKEYMLGRAARGERAVHAGTIHSLICIDTLKLPSVDIDMEIIKKAIISIGNECGLVYDGHGMWVKW